MWVDGKDASTIDSDQNGLVNGWTDKSSKGNDLGKWDNGSRPTVHSDGGITLQNGKWLVTQPWTGSTPVELGGNRTLPFF